MYRGGFDPFANVHSMMRRQMQEMEELMMDPFGMMGNARYGGARSYAPRQQMIDDNVDREGRSRMSRSQHDPFDALMPFGGGFGGLLGGGLFGGIGSMMQQMEQQALNNPNAHVYTQSTVIGMTPGADGRMNYYERSNSVRKAGDVKETRETLRDTSKGVEKMSIGHHIGDRGHVIQKKRDRSGQIVENQEFVGLSEDQAHAFDREWSSATRQAVGGSRNRLQQRSTDPRHLAIEEGSSRSDRRERHASPYARASDRRKPRGPIIEEVE